MFQQFTRKQVYVLHAFSTSVRGGVQGRCYYGSMAFLAEFIKNVIMVQWAMLLKEAPDFQS